MNILPYQDVPNRPTGSRPKVCKLAHAIRVIVMNATFVNNGSCKTLLQNAFAGIAVSICLTNELKAQAILPEDAPHTHNMLVMGENAVFLSHLPMFDTVSTKRPTYTSPHRFQVILQATLTRGNKSVQDVYSADRKDNPSTTIYTLSPETFVLTRLAASGPQPPPLSSFKGTVFRGHLEKGGKSIRGLQDIDVNIERVLYFREFDARQTKSSQLEYLLFGKGQEVFLAHLISGPPDFDQILSVNVLGHSFTDEELARGVRIVIPKSKNEASLRLKNEKDIIGEIPMAEGGAATSVKLAADVELYFEEGELLVPAKFDQTDEERKAHF
jgi:hypothetical protein